MLLVSSLSVSEPVDSDDFWYSFPEDALFCCMSGENEFWRGGICSLSRSGASEGRAVVVMERFAIDSVMPDVSDEDI